MATQLFLLNDAASTHRATNTAKIVGTTTGWNPKALGLSRGSGVTATANVATVTGTTLGLEVTDGTVPYEWLSEPVAANVTISGTITANIWAAESSMTANVAIDVIIDIVRSDSSNTIVQIVKSTFATELNLTTRTANNFTTGMTSGGYSSQTLNRGDRLRIRVFGDDGGGTMATGFTFNASFAGATAAADGDSYVTFTENITFESAPTSITQDTHDSPLVIGQTAAEERRAQSFTAFGPINSIQIYGRAQGAPTDDLVVELQSDSGGFPSGTVLASASKSGASIDAVTGVYHQFPISYSCVASTLYWIVARRSGALSATDYYRWFYSGSGSVYAGGSGAVYNTGVWQAETFAGDFRFIVSDGTPIYLTNAQSGLSAAPALISSFTGADENPLSEGGNWASLNSSGSPLQRVSNSAASSVASVGFSYWTPADFGPDLEAYITLSSSPTSTINIIAARIQGAGGAATWDGYAVDASGSGSQIRIYRYDNGVQTTLLTAARTWAVGDKVGIRIQGSTIQGWYQPSGGVWTLALSVVDTTYPSAGKIALGTGQTTRFIDDFYAATDSNLFTQKAWTSRGSGVVSYVSDTDAGWVTPLLTAEWFTPQLQAVTLTGLAQANIRALESSASANASLRCEIARVAADGSSPTVWASWPMSANNTRTGELNTSESAETINISGDDLAISDGQRLRIRLYNDDMPTTAMGNAFTVQRFYNGTSAGASGDSYITFPLALTEFSAGGTTYTKAGYGKESG